MYLVTGDDHSALVQGDLDNLRGTEKTRPAATHNSMCNPSTQKAGRLPGQGQTGYIVKALSEKKRQKGQEEAVGMHSYCCWGKMGVRQGTA